MDKFAATLGGPVPGTPTDNPLGASYAPLLQKFYDSTFQLGARSKALGAAGTQASFDVQNQNLDQQSAAQNALAESKQRMQSLKDAAEGKNYQVVKKQDGGFDYYDPLGNKINLLQYTNATGTSPAAVLKDSNNSLDKQFVSDYTHLQDLTNAYLNKDWTKVDKIGISLGLPDGQLRKTLEKGQIRPDDLYKQFISYYPNVFTNQPQGQTGAVRNVNQPAFSL